MVESYSGSMIKLTTMNYSLWKSVMEDLFNYKDLYDPIEGDNAKSSDMPDADWKKLKKKTLGVIRQWVDISLYNHVARETNLYTLWKNLENMYKKKNAQANIFLMRKLMNMKLKEGQSIVEHMNDFKGMIKQLSVTGLSLDDETQACLLLNPLPNSWNTLVVSLGNSTLEGKFTLAMIRNSLFNEEIRRKDFVGNDTHALITENRGRSKSRGPTGHNKSRGISKSRGKIKCYHYGKIGHMKKNYKILK